VSFTIDGETKNQRMKDRKDEGAAALS